MMKRLSRMFVIAALLCVAIMALSSGCSNTTYSISGTITGEGIDGVDISVMGTAKSALSDTSGAYSITDLKGTKKIVANKEGYTYTPTERTVTGPSATVDFVGSQITSGPSIVSMCGGEWHTLAIKDDGHVLAAGDNGRGQLGINSFEDSEVPVEVLYISGVTDIACGDVHSAAISNGDLYTWGSDLSGQLGDGGTTDDVPVPTMVTAVPDVEWADVACGGDHTIALTDTHVVYTWGYDGYGQLGRTPSEEHPANLPGAVNLDAFLPAIPVAVFAGDSHSLVLMSGGGMVAWGTNYYGELGAGYTATYTSTPVSVLITGVEKVTAGDFHTLVQKSSGELYTWGYNWQGQLGDGSLTECATPKHVAGYDDAVDFVAKGDSTFVVKSDGTVWAWGSNSGSYLGTGSTSSKVMVPEQVENLADIVNVYGGYDYTFAFESDKTMWCWGENGSGQLGDGTFDSKAEPATLSW
ncbi:MAG TPA: hypothetical protein PLI88_05250 [Bacillota bacterium]|nr:hypothetical protein [Bacillota bacterium]HOH10550.1 hypothetical protein [Bacillota bacterium]HOY88368.1 hypothetical protein [Bacillota bacterium]HPI01537.1 hypothetical protein [Bacillota bacterium]HPM64036.1 hypothetical protein [Bacillota bacterium]